MKYYGYVYLTEILTTGMCYIGKHTSKYVRSTNTKDKKYLWSGTAIKEAVKKYGRENVVLTIIEWCETADELSKREVYWLQKCKVVESPHFYNKTYSSCGWRTDAPWNKGLHGVQTVTPAMLAALERGRHLPASDKLKEKLRNRKEFVEYTTEYREKLSKANTQWFKENPCCYMYSADGKKTRVKLVEKEKYLNNGYLPCKEYKANLESSTTNR